MLPQSKPPPQTPPGAHHCRCSIHFSTQEGGLSWQPPCPYGQSETESLFIRKPKHPRLFMPQSFHPPCHCEAGFARRGNLLSVGCCIHRKPMSLRATKWRGNPFPLSMFHLQNRCKRSTDCHGSSSLAMTEDFGCIKNGLPYCP